MHSDDNDDSDGISAYLTGPPAGGGSSASAVAEAVATAFQGIDQGLSPILGKRGVAALYKRSLHVASRSHSWLPATIDGVPAEVDVASLQSSLAAQPAADAVAAGTVLLRTFHALLTSLIGPQLTARLLRPVWAIFLSGSAAEDTKS